MGINLSGAWKKTTLLKTSVKTILCEVYPVFVFALLYYLVYTLYTFFKIKSAPQNTVNLFNFFTSPFNFEEVLPQYSHSVSSGLYNNFLVVMIIMIIFAICNILAAERHYVHFSLPSVFLAGVVATYAVSAITWIINKKPGTGTSIIAFTVVETLVFMPLPAVYIKLRSRAVRKLGLKDIINLILLVVVSFTFLYFLFHVYIFRNINYPFHLFGGALAGFIIWRYTRRKENNKRVVPA